MSVLQILGSLQHSYPASLINHIYWNTKYSFIREQSHRNHFTAIKRLLNAESMSEIKDMYDRHPSIKSIKSITSITIITRRVVSIDFYRLIDTIDNVYVIDIDSYRFIEWFAWELCKGAGSRKWTTLTGVITHKRTLESTESNLLLPVHF